MASRNAVLELNPWQHGDYQLQLRTSAYLYGDLQPQTSMVYIYGGDLLQI